jgi:UDP-hydrolysing UDP-N-acetyl-D-glucosamine 2-epimerase
VRASSDSVRILSPLRVVVVTGTRAEYGLLAPLIARLRHDPLFDCRLIVTGSHLDRRHGLTVREIEADRVPIAARVPLNQRGDDGAAVAEAMAAAVRGLSRAYSRLKPRLVVVLGDRFEAFAAAAAALPLRIPVAHLHGGEATEGVWDESLRHAITKLSHLHFAAAPQYAARLKRLGEDPRRVFLVGSPAADRLRELPRLSRRELEKSLGLTLKSPLIVATMHPVTLSADRGLSESRALLAALAKTPGTIVLTAPNADAGGRAIHSLLKAFAKKNKDRTVLVDSLGQKRYYSLLALADAMAGNSSSGVLESAYFALPTVNLGSRQGGRLRLQPTLDVPRPTAAAVGAALKLALKPGYRARLRRKAAGSASPSDRIIATLKKIKFGPALLVKRFHDGP